MTGSEDRRGRRALTFLFTDVVDSTPTFRRAGDDLRRRHFEQLRAAVSASGGEEVKNVGDGLMAAFESPTDAVLCAVAIQRSADAHSRRNPDQALRVRVGVHIGEATREDGDYFGTPVVVASRLCAHADGGQILVSDIVRSLVGDNSRVLIDPIGVVQLKGVDEPVAVASVSARTRSVTRRPRTRRSAAFAGRSAEMELLTAELDRARSGELRIVLVTGEAGLGKSALAAHLIEGATSDSIALTARAHPLGTSTSFGPWIEALERYLRTLPAEDVRELAGTAGAELAPLLRSVEASRSGRSSREASGYRLVEDLVALVAAITGDAPVVLVLDDVHLADAPSWETLHFLARDRPDIPMLVVATARPDELAEHPVGADVVLALEQEGTLRRLRLGPMSREELAMLARSRLGRDVVPGALVEWLEERSRGNVLFALGLVGALLEEGADLTSPSLTTLPEDLSERVRARLRGLDDDTRSTLELLAVLGSRIELADLRRVSGRTMDALAMSLEELMRRRLVAEDETGAAPAYEVAHPLVQDAVYASIVAARRQALHRSIGRTLLAAGSLAAAAAHLARSAEPGDTEAVDALISALEEAEDRALYRAVTSIMRELVALLPEGDERWLRVVDVMDPRAEWVLAHLAEDHVAEAREAMLRIGALVDRDDDVPRRALVQLRLACFAGIGTGHIDEGIAAARLAAELYERAGEPGLAIASRTEEVLIGVMRDGHQRSTQRLRSLAADAATAGDDIAEIHALIQTGFQLTFEGKFAAAEDAILEAMRRARESGSYYRTELAHNWYLGILALGGRVLEALSQDTHRDNPASIDALANEQRIRILWLAGDLEGALAAFAKARTRNRTTISPRQAAFLALGVRAAIEAGRPDGVEDLLARIATATSPYGWVWAVYPGWIEAVLAWCRGSAASVDGLMAGAVRLRELDAPSDRLWTLFDVAEAATDFGRPEAAAWAAAEAADAAAAMSDFPLYTALADAIDAMAHADVARGEAAVAVFERLGYRLWLGRTHLAVGRAMARRGDDGAVELVNRAVEILTSCGADWHRDRALETLRSLGSRGRRAAGAVGGPSSLTAREAEVARLAASGSTAKEIGEALFIGERTVETHLANAYAKLGVRTKRELMQRASELGLRT